MKTNRIADYLEDDEPEPPQGAKEREEYWNESVFKALAQLRAKLRSTKSETSLAAAIEILQLERTRIRHGGRIAGTGNGVMSKEEADDEMNRTVYGRSKPMKAPVAVTPSTKPEAQPKPDATKEAKAFDAHVAFIEAAAPELAAQLGVTGYTLTHEQAVAYVRRILDRKGKAAADVEAIVVTQELWLDLEYIKEQRLKRANSAVAA